MFKKYIFTFSTICFALCGMTLYTSQTRAIDYVPLDRFTRDYGHISDYLREPATLPDLEISQATLKKTQANGKTIYETTALYKNNDINDITKDYTICFFGQHATTGELFTLSVAHNGIPSNIPILHAQEQLSMTDYASVPGTTYAIMVKIDCDDQIHESNEDNNIYWIGINNVLQPITNDLGLRFFRFEKIDGYHVRVLFDVINYGLADAHHIDLNLAKNYSMNNTDYALFSKWVPTFEAGRQKTFSHVIKTRGIKGNNFIATVDKDNNLIENNEFNNELIWQP